MDEAKNLLALSWQVQVHLAIGWLAFCLAYRGWKRGMEVAEKVFAALVFAGMSSTIAWFWPGRLGGIGWGLAAAATGTFLIAAIWRGRARELLERLLWHAGIATANDEESVWARIVGDGTYFAEQIQVFCDDGTVYFSDNTRRFMDLPYAAYRLGGTGDVALYATRVRRSDGTILQRALGASFEAGEIMTYIPASRVKRVAFRFNPTRVNRLAGRAEGPGAQTAAAPAAASP